MLNVNQSICLLGVYLSADFSVKVIGLFLFTYMDLCLLSHLSLCTSTCCCFLLFPFLNASMCVRQSVHQTLCLSLWMWLLGGVRCDVYS